MDHHQPPSLLVQKVTLLPFPIFHKRELTYAFSFLLILFLSFLLLNLKDPFLPFLNISLRSSILPINRNSAIQSCDYSYGRWVRDDSYLLQLYGEECPFIDAGFRCRQNGRKDYDFLKWRWQPHGCDLPRFNASDLLERSRNGRIIFVGDSLGRNQWESLLCMLAQAVSDKSTIYEENGNPVTKHKGYLSMRFHDYNLTVEHYRSPFLVRVDRAPKNSSENIRKVIRIDQLDLRSKRWIGADVIIFNEGHWWNKEKTINAGFYFEEGGRINITMNLMEAFHKSLLTLKSWIIQNLDPVKSNIFFRSYSPTHYMNGAWDGGGRCDSFTVPETNYTLLEKEPWNNLFIYEAIKEIELVYKNAEFLNITYLTEFRKDGHSSLHKEPERRDQSIQDCSHWCLPGVPDTWNELLYARLLSRNYRAKTSK